MENDGLEGEMFYDEMMNKLFDSLDIDGMVNHPREAAVIKFVDAFVVGLEYLGRKQARDDEVTEFVTEATNEVIDALHLDRDVFTKMIEDSVFRTKNPFEEKS
jgi:hypothetical protein